MDKFIPSSIWFILINLNLNQIDIEYILNMYLYKLNGIQFKF